MRSRTVVRKHSAISNPCSADTTNNYNNKTKTWISIALYLDHKLADYIQCNKRAIALPVKIYHVKCNETSVIHTSCFYHFQIVCLAIIPKHGPETRKNVTKLFDSDENLDEKPTSWRPSYHRRPVAMFFVESHRSSLDWSPFCVVSRDKFRMTTVQDLG